MESDNIYLHDIELPDRQGPTLRIAHYIDAGTENMHRLPEYARKGLNRGLQSLTVSVPCDVQVYCSKSVLRIKETTAPFLISSLTEEYAFSISFKGGALSVRRRYASVNIPPTLSLDSNGRSTHV